MGIDGTTTQEPTVRHDNTAIGMNGRLVYKKKVIVDNRHGCDKGGVC
jgi:hypothetical protein